MKVKEESEEVGLKFNIQKTKIMASGPITSWEIDGETVETVADFIFWGSKITADDDCLVAQRLKRLPPVWETGFNPWVWEEGLEKGKATHTHSSILASRITWTVYGITKSQT